MTRLLVVGASGLLGGETVLAALDRGVEVVAVNARSALRPPHGAVARRLDVAEPDAAASLVAEVRPDWIVNAAAAVDVDALEADSTRADRLNVQLPGALAAAAGQIGSRLVHVSTDLVFDGTLARPYKEEDQTAPVNVYGASKLAGERAVLDADRRALVVRTTIYGWNATAKASLAEWFLGRLESGGEAPGFDDAWFTPINTAHLAEALLDLLTLPAWPPAAAPGGVLHVAGGGCISKREFGQRLAATFTLDPDLVRPAKMSDHEFPARRTGWACLDSGRAAAILGREAPSVDAGLARFRADRETGRRAALRRMGGSE
jgi:dTDP-4-dehydrorhamnose reductase